MIRFKILETLDQFVRAAVTFTLDGQTLNPLERND